MTTNPPIPASTYYHRLTTAAETLDTTSAYLITNHADLYYLTGIATLVPSEREAALLLTKTNGFVFHGRFSPVTQLPNLTYIPGAIGNRFAPELATYVKAQSIRNLALDKQSLTVSEYEAIQGACNSTAPNSVLTLTELSSAALHQRRAVKDAQELAQIVTASQIAAVTYQEIAAQLKPGLSERQVHNLINCALLEHGSTEPAFPTIVAFGPHTALPHHQPTDQPLTPETPVLLDFGATVAGYRSDMTRTLWFGQQPSPRFQKIEKIIMQAYQAALAVCATLPCSAKSIDHAARDVITKAGFSNEFIHTTGHGVGIDIHEFPSLGSYSEAMVTPGMVITIEPGIYLEGEFGFRYENTVVVESKVEVLTATENEWT